MSRWMHRTCDTTLAARDTALREAEERVRRLTAQLEAEERAGRHLRDLLTQADKSSVDLRLKHQEERAQHAAELEVVHGRESALRKELTALKAREEVLAQRRRRAAETALGGAWDGPGHESSPGCAQVAQALLALPLASYDVMVAYQRDGNGDWYWAVDGEPINPHRYSHFTGTSSEGVLLRRFGFTDFELSRIRRDAERAHRRLQDLVSEEF